MNFFGHLDFNIQEWRVCKDNYIFSNKKIVYDINHLYFVFFCTRLTTKTSPAYIITLNNFPRSHFFFCRDNMCEYIPDILWNFSFHNQSSFFQTGIEKSLPCHTSLHLSMGQIIEQDYMFVGGGFRWYDREGMSGNFLSVGARKCINGRNSCSSRPAPLSAVVGLGHKFRADKTSQYPLTFTPELGLQINTQKVLSPCLGFCVGLEFLE